MYYINYFFLFSLIGHFVETFFYTGGGESGILFGPYTPIYGFGVCAIIIFNKKIAKLSNGLKTLALFLFGFIFLSIIELTGGLLIEKLFGFVFWSYESLTFHIGHYIALEVAIVWGACSIIVAKLIVPL